MYDGKVVYCCECLEEYVTTEIAFYCEVCGDAVCYGCAEHSDVCSTCYEDLEE